MGVVPVHARIVKLGKILAIKNNAPLDRLIKPQDGLHQARFSTPAFAYNSDCLALVNIKSNAVYSLHIPSMTKPETFEFEPDVKIIDR